MDNSGPAAFLFFTTLNQRDVAPMVEKNSANPVAETKCFSYAVPTSKMRPISILSTWWRIFIHAKLSSDAAQQWYQQQLQPQQHGCRKGKKAVTALIPLATAKAKGHFLASLDFSQAFDRTRPA